MQTIYYTITFRIENFHSLDGIQKASADSKDLFRKEKICPEYPVDKEEGVSQPTLNRKLENWGADDSVLAEAVQLDDDDLVRSKSLESLYKNQALRLTKPIAVIEPKIIYQLANLSPLVPKVEDVGKDSGKEVAAQVRKEAGTNNFSSSTAQTESDAAQKSAMRAKDIPRDIKTNVNYKGNKVSPVTLLDISQSSAKIQSKPLSLKVGQASKETDNKLPAEEHQGEDRDECSEWDDEWEDMEVSSIAEDQPKILTKPSHFSSNNIHIGSTNPPHSSLYELVSDSPCQPLEKPKANWPSNCHPTLSEEPLGFGYDIKQIRVKVKPGSGIDEDVEWKLFEDLIPSLESQKKSCDYNSTTLNLWDSNTTQDKETGTRVST